MKYGAFVLFLLDSIAGSMSDSQKAGLQDVPVSPRLRAPLGEGMTSWPFLGDVALNAQGQPQATVVANT